MFVSHSACGKEPTKGGFIFSIVVVGLVLSGWLIWCICKCRKRQKGLQRAGTFARAGFSCRDFLLEIQGKEGANICKLFTYEELQKATNNFATNMELGSGGFGTVFEETLNDGTKVAIKKAKHNVEGHNNTKQFINEVTVLSQVNHRNLVKLLGCCLEIAVPVLVYEFIPNGNLLEHLRRNSVDVPGEVDGGPDNIFYPSSTRLPFDWNNRLKVAIGTAEALTYLHSGTSLPIYHRGLKTANILLDENYNAKVADFGLSKLVPLEATHLSTEAPALLKAEEEGSQTTVRDHREYGPGGRQEQLCLTEQERPTTSTQLISTKRVPIDLLNTNNSRADDRFCSPDFVELLKDTGLGAFIPASHFTSNPLPMNLSKVNQSSSSKNST